MIEIFYGNSLKAYGVIKQEEYIPLLWIGIDFIGKYTRKDYYDQI